MEINDADINLLLKFATFVNSKTQESIQDYKSNNKLIGYMVRFKKNNKITAIWFDAEKLAERHLKYFFKWHKQSDKQFFIEFLDNNFYRIGFKLKKPLVKAV